MKAYYDKLDFGRSLNENNHGDCFNYGIVDGCDECCPALLDGECENINEILEQLEDLDIDLSEIKELYKEQII
jgi:hypothetical protein